MIQKRFIRQNMNFWERLTIAVLEWVASLVKGRLIDHRTGNLLLDNIRAMPAAKRKRLLFLLHKLSSLEVLRHKPRLKDKLLFLTGVLEGRVIKAPMQFVSSKITTHQRN